MTTAKAPARDRIFSAAETHGWRYAWNGTHTVQFLRGPEVVSVTFSDVSPSRPLAQRVTGAYATVPSVSGVHNGTRGITGADKAGQVIARLRQPRAL